MKISFLNLWKVINLSIHYLLLITFRRKTSIKLILMLKYPFNALITFYKLMC